MKRIFAVLAVLAVTGLTLPPAAAAEPTLEELLEELRDLSTEMDKDTMGDHVVGEQMC